MMAPLVYQVRFMDFVEKKLFAPRADVHTQFTFSADMHDGPTDAGRESAATELL